MDEIYSIPGIIALWLVLSVSLWWLRRRWVHSKQNLRIDRVETAVKLLREARPVFDAIRFSASSKTGSADMLRVETYALLKRIQESGAFFDQAAQLRAQLEKLAPPIECLPLAEILHIRRDLWAASEIVLADDLQRFGEAFSSEAAFERFRAEAISLLFKQSQKAADDDLIDIRLALAVEEADSSLGGVKDEVSNARERDRLPTLAEAIAYPVAAIRAVPGKLRAAKEFARRSYRSVIAGAHAIRQSETMARGVEGLRHARQGLPQRVSIGLDRASALTRDGKKRLGKHYEFLLAAYDYQAKYEQLLRKAPELTERGKQFITRLEFAERSERLRLNSANFLIWLWRGFLHGLAYSIATLQKLHIAYLEARARRSLKPQPLRHMHTSAFAAASPGNIGLLPVKTEAVFQAANRATGGRKKPKAAKAQAAAQLSVQPAVTPKQTNLVAKKNGSAVKEASGGKISKAGMPADQAASPVATEHAPPAKNGKGRKQKTKTKKNEVPAELHTPSSTMTAMAKPDEAAASFAATLKSADAVLPSNAVSMPAPASKASEVATKRLAALPISGKTVQVAAPVSENVTHKIEERKRAAKPVVAANEDRSLAQAAAEEERLVYRSKRRLQPEFGKIDAKQRASALTHEPSGCVSALARSKPRVANPAISAALEPMPPQIEAGPIIDEPQRKRASIFGRLIAPLRRRGRQGAENDEAAFAIADIVSQVVNEANLTKEREKFSPLIVAGGDKPELAPRQSAPTLLAKLSGIAERAETLERTDGEAEQVEDEAIDDVSFDDPAELDIGEDAGISGEDDDDDLGPLTRSVMEAQIKYAAEEPQIRSFPWLRRWDNECL